MFEWQLIGLSHRHAHAVEGESQKRPENDEQNEEADQDERQHQKIVVIFAELVRLIDEFYCCFDLGSIAAEYAEND